MRGIVAETMAQMTGQLGVQLKEEQLGIGVHSADDFAGVTAFAGAEFRDDAGC